MNYLINTYGNDAEFLGGLRIKTTPHENAITAAVHSLVDNDLVSFGGYNRFLVNKEVLQAFLKCVKVPAVVGFLLVPHLKAQIANRLKDSGYTSYHDQEKLHKVRAAVDALAELLGDGPFFGGQGPILAGP